MAYDEFEFYTCSDCPYFLKSKEFCRHQNESKKANQKVCEEYGQIIEDYKEE